VHHDARVVRTLLHVQHVDRLVVTVTNRSGVRLPLLAQSRVGSIRIGYWRKAIVVGPQRDGRLDLVLRIPARLAKQHLVLHARAQSSPGARARVLAVAVGRR
jgi:hypothetical protein